MKLGTLPKWAQEHIRILEMRNGELQRENNALRSSTEPSRVCLHDPTAKHSGKSPFFFRPDARFEFSFGKDGAITVGFNGDDRLEVMAVGRASPTLLVMPQMSNVACVAPRTR